MKKMSNLIFVNNCLLILFRLFKKNFNFSFTVNNQELIYLSRIAAIHLFTLIVTLIYIRNNLFANLVTRLIYKLEIILIKENLKIKFLLPNNQKIQKNLRKTFT